MLGAHISKRSASSARRRRVASPADSLAEPAAIPIDWALARPAAADQFDDIADRGRVPIDVRPKTHRAVFTWIDHRLVAAGTPCQGRTISMRGLPRRGPTCAAMRLASARRDTPSRLSVVVSDPGPHPAASRPSRRAALQIDRMFALCAPMRPKPSFNKRPGGVPVITGTPPGREDGGPLLPHVAVEARTCDRSRERRVLMAVRPQDEDQGQIRRQSSRPRIAVARCKSHGRARWLPTRKACTRSIADKCGTTATRRWSIWPRVRLRSDIT